jgi:hypothetical protein
MQVTAIVHMAVDQARAKIETRPVDNFDIGFTAWRGRGFAVRNRRDSIASDDHRRVMHRTFAVPEMLRPFSAGGTVRASMHSPGTASQTCLPVRNWYS